MKELTELLTRYVAGAPENRIEAEYALSPAYVGLPIYEAPLVTVGDAADPLFEQLKAPEAAGDWFRAPKEWLPGARRVISVFLPYSREIKDSNGPGAEPSELWLHGRIEGQQFLARTGRWLCAELEKRGYAALAPALHPEYRAVEKAAEPGGPSFRCNWSERHVAFVCGMGTFGLSRGLITEKGICGRFISIVTDWELPVTERPYTDIYEYCSFCGACIRRCPVNAITAEGKEHEPCCDYLAAVLSRHAPRYGCGKCQVKVPCMNGIPKKRER